MQPMANTIAFCSTSAVRNVYPMQLSSDLQNGLWSRAARDTPRRPKHRLVMGFDPVLFTMSTLVSSIAFIAYEGRPRGGLEIDAGNLEVRQSSVEGAGLGLFATTDLPADSCLGSYPGRLWPAGLWLRFKGGSLIDVFQSKSPERERVQQKARSYVWKLENGNIIDPTSSEGDLPDTVSALGSEISTVLCRINEPSSGFDTNVVTVEDGDTLQFRLERDVREGEELFLDYGPFYDRTGYLSNVLGTLIFPDD